MLPTRNVNVNPILIRFGATNFQIMGIGRIIIQMSVKKLGTVIQDAKIRLFQQRAPGILGSQFAAMGVQVQNSRIVRIMV